MGNSQSTQQDQSEEVLAEVQAEADKLLDYQISWAMQSDEEILRLLRLNIVVLGVLASIFGAFGTRNLRTDEFFILGVTLSLVFWVFSVVVALVAYKFNKIIRGFEKWPDEEFDSLDFDNIESISEMAGYYRGILSDYEKMIKSNQENIDCKYTLHVGAVWMMVISLVLLGSVIGRAILSKFDIVLSIVGTVAGILGIVSIICLFLLMKDFTAVTDRDSRLDFLNPYDKNRSWRIWD